MVQSPNPWNRDDLTRFSGFNRPFFGSIFLRPEVGSVRVVVVDAGSDHSSKLALMDRDHMIQAIAS